MNYLTTFIFFFAIGFNSIQAQNENAFGHLSIGIHNQHQYFLSNESLTWEAAYERAQEVGGYLVAINSEAENQFLQGQLNTDVWLGYLSYNDIYAWLDGTALEYTNYATAPVENQALLDAETGLWKVSLTPTARFVIEIPITYIEDCSTFIGEGEVLCSEKLSDNTYQIYTLNTAQEITSYQLDSTGQVLASQPEGLMVTDSFFVENNQITKKNSDGSIAWTKSIPDTILNHFPTPVIATETVDGDILLGAVGTYYANFPMIIDSVWVYDTSKSQDSILVFRLDEELNFQNYTVVRTSHEISPGFDYPLDYTQIRHLSSESDGGFLIAYEWYNGPAVYEARSLGFKKYNSSNSLIVDRTFYGNFSPTILSTPCGEYRVNRSINMHSNGGGTTGNGTLWLSGDLEIIQNTESVDRWGWAAFPWSEKGFYNNQDSVSLGYYTQSGSINKSTMSLRFTDTDKLLSMLKIPFTYLIRTGDKKTLIFYATNSGLKVFNSDCLNIENCELEVLAQNIQCDDNGTQDIKEDDTFTLDLAILGNGTTWSASCNGASSTGFFNVPTSTNSFPIDNSNDIYISGGTSTDCKYLLEDIDVNSCSYDLPDLVPISIQKSGTVFQTGDSLYIQFEVENIGARAPYEETCTIKYELRRNLDLSQWSSLDISEEISINIEPGEVKTFEKAIFLNKSVPEDSLYLNVRIDSGYPYIEELDEGNNRIIDSIPIFVNSSPDIILKYVRIYEDSIQQGENVFTGFGIDNDIQAPIEENLFLVGYYLSTDKILDSLDVFMEDKYVSSQPLDNLGYVSLGNTITIPPDFPIGEYYLILDADYENTVHEYDEGNNIMRSETKLLVQEADLLFDDTNNFTSNKWPTVKNRLQCSLSPNPVQNTLWLDIETPQKGDFNLAIYNAQQQLLKTKQIQLEKGQQRVNIQTDFLESGIYFLELIDNSGQGITNKFIKI